MHHFMIAAPSSNSGKTTVTLGLLRLLKNRGFKVQPFKSGPDYIDPKHHRVAADKTSINLDAFMMDEAHISQLYEKHRSHCDIAVTEGVMGLFDGFNKMEGSSAALARTLQIPVILVINAKAMAYTAAAIIHGLKNFDPQVNVAGVIFNFVNSESHYQYLKDACEDTGVAALGYIPENQNLRVPSRHLGLSIDNGLDLDSVIEAAAEHISKTVDITAILEISRTYVIAIPDAEKASVMPVQKKLTIAVAYDEAFNFIYQENLNSMETLADICYFSPLKDKAIPAADIVYLPGGYPEFYLPQLAENEAMRRSLFQFCEKGGKVYAECGGLMYLGNEIIDEDGKAFPMTGFLKLTTSMAKKKLALGYRTIQLNDADLKGHEFHYSTITENEETPKNIRTLNARGMEVNSRIFIKDNVIASYIHLYWGNSGFMDMLNKLRAENKILNF